MDALERGVGQVCDDPKHLYQRRCITHLRPLGQVRVQLKMVWQRYREKAKGTQTRMTLVSTQRVLDPRGARMQSKVDLLFSSFSLLSAPKESRESAIQR